MSAEPEPTSSPHAHAPSMVLGRYALFDELASGGMATVHLGRLLGPVGFSRTVAIKRLHPQHAKDPEFVAMFLDEARLAARIRHPNVVATLDVVATEGEVFLVMEYVEGESLSHLVGAVRRRQELVPPRIAAHIACGALQGLHAAHEAKNDHGEPLNLIHRDVSPQNILVCVDGIPRVLDFGVAKAMGRLQTTDEGRIKGKLAYMAPEQLSGKHVTRKTDIFAASIVLFESLTAKRLFQGNDPGEVVARVLNAPIPAPGTLAPGVPPELDAVVLKGLSRDPAQRYDTALEMAVAIEKAMGLVSAREVGEWVRRCAATKLEERAQKVAEVESSSSVIDAVDALRAARAVQANVSSSPVSSPAPIEGGTERSQVGAVVDQGMLEPKQGSRRFLPFVGAASLVIAIALAAVVWKTRAAAPVPTTTAAATPAPIASEAPPPPSADVPVPAASVSAALAPSAAPPTSASATSAAPKPVKASKPGVKPKPAQPGSIYSRD